MKRTKLPSLDRLKALLDYNKTTGHLIWHERPRSDFSADWAHQRWNKMYVGKRAGSKNQKIYVQVMIDGLLHSGHRIAFKLVTGRDVDEVDHINRVRGDNRWVNLREATHSQNMLNTAVRRDNKLGIKGVHMAKRANGGVRYNVGFCGKYVGCYKTIDEAVAAYKRCAS